MNTLANKFKENIKQIGRKLQLWVALNSLSIQIFQQFNPFQPNIDLGAETSNIFCTANQITRFYMECNTGLNLVNLTHRIESLSDPKYRFGKRTRIMRSRHLIIQKLWVMQNLNNPSNFLQWRHLHCLLKSHSLQFPF